MSLPLRSGWKPFFSEQDCRDIADTGAAHASVKRSQRLDELCAPVRRKRSRWCAGALAQPPPEQVRHSQSCRQIRIDREQQSKRCVRLDREQGHLHILPRRTDCREVPILAALLIVGTYRVGDDQCIEFRRRKRNRDDKRGDARKPEHAGFDG